MFSYRRYTLECLISGDEFRPLEIDVVDEYRRRWRESMIITLSKKNWWRRRERVRVRERWWQRRSEKARDFCELWWYFSFLVTREGERNRLRNNEGQRKERRDEGDCAEERAAETTKKEEEKEREKWERVDWLYSASEICADATIQHTTCELQWWKRCFNDRDVNHVHYDNDEMLTSDKSSDHMRNNDASTLWCNENIFYYVDVDLMIESSDVMMMN